MNERQEAYKEGETDASLWQIYQSETGKTETERTQGKKIHRGTSSRIGETNMFMLMSSKEREKVKKTRKRPENSTSERKWVTQKHFSAFVTAQQVDPDRSEENQQCWSRTSHL